MQIHPLKSASGSLPIVIAPIVLYTDDFSGNRSKKWNKFDAWCLSLGGLPQSEAKMFHNIHFIACSNNVSTMQIVNPLVDDLVCLENGLRMFDAYSNSMVYVIAPYCVNYVTMLEHQSYYSTLVVRQTNCVDFVW